ncbi:DUF5819 family protein [Microbacterium gilvum]|uniref:Uncharacterized protein n=1 Tax=Microbacterium gilvum TaxID=1336204 RepID=A0ABP9A585_9MICO
MRPHPRTLRRTVVAVLTAFAAWHILTTFLWAAPAAPERDAAPGGILASSIQPLFDQDAAAFAAAGAPVRVDVRAALEAGEGDAAEITGWVAASEVELSTASGIAVPRSAALAASAGRDLLDAWLALSDAQRQTAALNWFRDGWDSRLADGLGEDDAARAYLDADETLTAYATQVAAAVWGEDVARVQFHVTTEPSAADRGDQAASTGTGLASETGWRGLVVRAGQDPVAFADAFCGAPEKVCG